ncbi:hypothetical protein PGB90_003450 [Kerria lacca]
MPSTEFAILILILQTTSLNAFESVKLAKSNHLKMNRDHRNSRQLSDRVINNENLTNLFYSTAELDRFQIIQSNVIRIANPNLKLKSKLVKREAIINASNITDIDETTSSQIPSNVTVEIQASKTTETLSKIVTDLVEVDRRSKKFKEGDDRGHKKKKKKVKKGFYSIFGKLHKMMPDFMKKMHGPSMFMIGMAQANFNNFVMHALMMSKMALISVVLMIVREMVFGDREQPVKYYNFGYDHHPPHKRLVSSYDYHEYPYDYKRRRKRNTKK